MNKPLPLLLAIQTDTCLLQIRKRFSSEKRHLEPALQIMDYNKNGHKNKEQLLEHARNTLIKAGWHMGEGRTEPPLSYNDFVKAWDTWI